MKVYTGTGDDGTTGLFYGGRVPKNSEQPQAYGAVDEAQAFIGLARAEVPRDSEMDQLLTGLARDLYVLMAELATLAENHHKLDDGVSKVTVEMATRLEELIDDISARFDPPTEFVVPGQTRLAALLDVSRTVVRRAERASIDAAAPGSSVVLYLNRLSDLLWTMARWQEGQSVLSRDA